MNKKLKEQAIILRKEGWSYTIISRKLRIPKSTLSGWLRSIPYNPHPKVVASMLNAPTQSAIARNKIKRASIEAANQQAQQDIGGLSKRDLFMLGLGIYLGEGKKSTESVRIINADPQIIKIAMRWFREVCNIPLQNFSLAIHIYPDITEKEALKFWSELTLIPIEQFGKTQVDKRTNKSELKKGKTPYGTAHITIRSCGNKDFGVFLHRRIMGWINAVTNQAGIV